MSLISQNPDFRETHSRILPVWIDGLNTMSEITGKTSVIIAQEAVAMFDLLMRFTSRNAALITRGPIIQDEPIHKHNSVLSREFQQYPDILAAMKAEDINDSTPVMLAMDPVSKIEEGRIYVRSKIDRVLGEHSPTLTTYDAHNLFAPVFDFYLPIFQRLQAGKILATLEANEWADVPLDAFYGLDALSTRLHALSHNQSIRDN